MPSLHNYSFLFARLTRINLWSTKQKTLPYGLISDPDRVLITALGAGKNGKTNRSHFIFEKGTGKLIDKKIPVKPADRYVAVRTSISLHYRFDSIRCGFVVEANWSDVCLLFVGVARS